MGRRQRRAEEERTAQHRQAVESLPIYDALALAMEKRREVFEVVEASLDRDAAVAGIQRLLGTSELPALTVLDCQLRRFTARDRVRITEERDRLRALVERAD